MASCLCPGEQRTTKKSEWAIELACLYGPAALLLPAEMQMQLWRGRDKARAYKQAIHWDTCSDELSPERVKSVYTELYGADRADNIVSMMARAKKEAEADAILDGAG